MQLTKEQEEDLARAMKPLFDLWRNLPRNTRVGFQGPVDPIALWPVLIGRKLDGTPMLSDPSDLFDGTPSLCWREWARVNASEIISQSSDGPKAGGVNLLDALLQVSGGRGSPAIGTLLDIFRKVGDRR
jgi:hypothetical protein